MISVKIRHELSAAVGNAKDYTKGKNLGALRGAFDGMCSQICHSLFGTKPMNRMMARKLVNDSLEQGEYSQHLDLIRALHGALRASDLTLFRKEYVDHTVSIEKFILEELRNVLRCIP